MADDVERLARQDSTRNIRLLLGSYGAFVRARVDAEAAMNRAVGSRAKCTAWMHVMRAKREERRALARLQAPTDRET